MIETHFYPRAQNAINRGTHQPFDLVGYIPMGLNPDDPRDAVSQLHASYGHGGGWDDFEGFGFRDSETNPQLTYPGDPPTDALAFWKIRDERIILFDHAWVAVVQPNGSFRVARMD